MNCQLVVTYWDHTIMYYPVGPTRSWKIDAPARCLVVGRGIPRTYIPLDQVRSFNIAATFESDVAAGGVSDD